MNSCIGKALPACSPPFITLNAGTGRMIFELPARLAICLYNGTFWLAAPALQTANDTPRIALAPNLDLFSVPSNLIKKSSISAWLATLNF